MSKIELDRYRRNLEGCANYGDEKSFRAWAARITLSEISEEEFCEFLFQLNSQLAPDYFQIIEELVNDQCLKNFKLKVSGLLKKSKENELDGGVLKSDFDRLVINTYLNQNAHRLASEDDEVLFALRARRDRDRRAAMNSLAASMLSSGQKKRDTHLTEHVYQPKPGWVSKLGWSRSKTDKVSEVEKKITEALESECNSENLDLGEAEALLNSLSTRELHFLISEIAKGNQLGDREIQIIRATGANSFLLRYSEEACRKARREGCRTVFEKLDDGTVLPVFYLWEYFAEKPRILAFKKGDTDEVKRASEFFRTMIRSSSQIVCVPSHEADRTSAAFESVFRELRGSHLSAQINGVRRVITVPKKALSQGMAARNLRREIESIELRDAETFAGQRVVVIDDVTTSGTSLKAVASKLNEAGAFGVTAVVLGKTLMRN
jgi:hypothetical protein